MFRPFFLILFCLLTVSFAVFAKGISYSVVFEGLEDQKALKSLEMASQLISLEKRPPPSINALRYRAESDIPNLLNVLYAHGYYEAKVNITIQERYGIFQAIVWIDPGPRYFIEEFSLHLYCESQEEPQQSCCLLSLEDLDIQLNKPIRTQTILNAELKALTRLSQCGYPLAKIENREVIVDGKTKSVRVQLWIKTGEKGLFGPTQIAGTSRVKPEYLKQRIEWKEGAVYDSRLVENTQTQLLESGLFSSVLITHEDQLSLDKEIPVKIEVSETKHKTVNIGVSYQTVFGPGITFGWANRNVGGMGRTLSFQGEVTRISQTGVARYLHPQFLRTDQNMVAVAEAAHEALFAYSSRSYSVMDRFERKLTSWLRGSLSFQAERLYITESVHNGNYWLVEFPLLLRFSTANHLLNPTKGITVEFTAIPTLNTTDTKEFYLSNTLTQSAYWPLDRKEKVVFAQKLTCGTIWSNGINAIPLSKRFLGGTEEDLRGYRYRTVSPLIHHKPMGGRSAIFLSLETRFRLTEVIGLVPFFDIGSVWKTQLPSSHGKWVKSVGLGFRFFSFVGPFRVDLAFPLDRRKEIDPVYKVLVSIGQMF